MSTNKTVYDDEFYDGIADVKVNITLKEKSILEYERDLMKRILDTIAKCSDGSTSDAIKELAKLTLEDLK